MSSPVYSASKTPPASNSNVVVVLGPTNTGKTHFAVERMLGHSTGIIGLPLRLLAREIYDRVARARGLGSVALITGEEKILPPNPAYFVCTVEAMPMDRTAAFVAVDEIQLCADFERGHVFTDRILRARGREETMFMGAETMRPLLQQLLPGAQFITRPRFSQLTYAGARKLTRLPRRTAIVAFSAQQVYSTAEIVRRHRGGTAVVMGALSPRTRNAQVELYQNGDVDFLVATDAIGMGLNLDIEHVVFAATHKFDGFQHRALNAAEVAQIAGRAGRHLTDGTFGLTGDIEEGSQVFDRSLISAVEEHHFAPLKILQWRNAALDFSTFDALIRSLELPPDQPGLTKSLETSDLRALRNLGARPEIMAKPLGRHRLIKLWDACLIPDFRKISPEDHAQLAWDVFSHISTGAAVLSNEWMSRHLNPVDRVDGDIDSLSQRIAHVRTLTYIANRSDWLDDPKHWQGLTRDVEDRLSDALHERLSQRFVDRRTSVLLRALRRRDRLMASVALNGDILVEDQFIGRLEGFRFFPDEGVHGSDDKAVRNAAEQALGQEIAARAHSFSEAADEQITLKISDTLSEPSILWQGELLARLKKGSAALRPDFELVSTPLLQGDALTLVEERLRRWIDTTIANQMKPLVRLKEAIDKAEDLSGLAKGIAFQLFENLGSLPRRKIAQQLKEVDKDGRRQMRQLGIWLGATSLYLPALLKPQTAKLRAQLWSLDKEIPALPPLPKPGLITAQASVEIHPDYYEMAGYRPMGDLAVRLDMLERLFLAARARSEKGPFLADAEMMSLVGCSGETFEKIMGYLGYALTEVDASAIPVEKPVAAAVETEETASPEAVEATPETSEAEPVIELAAEATAEPAPEPTADLPPATDAAPVEETAVVAEPVKVKAYVRKSEIRPKREPRPRRRTEARTTGTSLKPEGEATDAAAKPERREYVGYKGKNPRYGRAESSEAGAGEAGRMRRPPRSENNGRPDRQEYRDKGKRDEKYASRPEKKEPVFDASSPFAVLMELKKSMARK